MPLTSTTTAIHGDSSAFRSLKRSWPSGVSLVEPQTRKAPVSNSRVRRGVSPRSLLGRSQDCSRAAAWTALASPENEHSTGSCESRLLNTIDFCSPNVELRRWVDIT